MKMSCRLIVLVLLSPVWLSLAGGCGSMDQSRKKDAAILVPPPVDNPPYIFHRVMEGETYATIAKWYSGDEAIVYRLKDENSDLDPVTLKKGDIVKVPVFLAVVHTEQPDDSTQPKKPQKAVRKGRGKPTVPVTSPTSNAVPEVFGPK
jgi:hypothetical protein